MRPKEAQHQITSLVIPIQEREMLEKLARDLGYLQQRGAGAGKLGNISALVCAIARGEVTLVAEQRKSGKDAC